MQKPNYGWWHAAYLLAAMLESAQHQAKQTIVGLL
jgi:hypothetical protein